jgi:transposase
LAEQFQIAGMKKEKQDDRWRMSDAPWQRIEPLLPAPKRHSLGCHRPRVPNRAAMDAILLVLRTGMQWNALGGTGIAPARRRTGAFGSGLVRGVSANFRRLGLMECDGLKGIEWD